MGCGGSFENRHCLIPLIGGQSERKFFSSPTKHRQNGLMAWWIVLFHGPGIWESGQVWFELGGLALPWWGVGVEGKS
jgi:hypothetical protein